MHKIGTHIMKIRKSKYVFLLTYTWNARQRNRRPLDIIALDNLCKILSETNGATRIYRMSST